MEPLLKVEEVMKLLNLSRSAVYAYVTDGTLPHLELGNHPDSRKKRRLIRFRRSDLEEWVRRHTQEGDNPVPGQVKPFEVGRANYTGTFLVVAFADGKVLIASADGSLEAVDPHELYAVDRGQEWPNPFLASMGISGLP